MTEVDPYNYPFPCKTQTMYLQTINQADAGYQKIKIFKPDSTALKTNDISGASPILPGYRYSEKETYVNRTNDIDGCFPKRLIKENISKTVFNLRNDDIKGTQPQINKFIATRHCNPLEPEYKLPSAQIKVSTPPKFIRDSINIRDIDGTRPNPYNLYKTKTHVYEEIEGSKPKKMFIPKDQINILDVRDINEYLQFKTSRITNPLNPVYITTDEEGKKMEIGEIEYSKSRRLHPIESKRDPSLDLRTKDIAGAWAGTHSEKFLRKEGRKHYIQTLKTDDIAGAQVSTLKKGMTTGRKLNPIWPFDAYPYLGVKEEIAEKLAANNLSTIKEGKNKVLESKTAIQSENLSKMTETMVHVPIIAATDSNFGDGIEKSIVNNANNEKNEVSALKNPTPKNVLPGENKSRKASEIKLEKKASQTSQKNGNLTTEQIPIVNRKKTKKEDEGEVNFITGLKKMPQTNYKTKMTTAQNFDKFVLK